MLYFRCDLFTPSEYKGSSEINTLTLPRSAFYLWVEWIPLNGTCEANPLSVDQSVGRMSKYLL